MERPVNAPIPEFPEHDPPGNDAGDHGPDPDPGRPVQPGHEDGGGEHGGPAAEPEGKPGTAPDPARCADRDAVTARTKKDPPEGYQAL
jgi:hypothetical protein